MSIRKRIARRTGTVKKHDLRFSHLLVVWRYRRTYLQIIRNFKVLEGSWLGGMRKLLTVYGDSP